MDDEQRQLVPAIPSALFLAGSGLAVLLANGILLNPVSRTILAAVAVGWGLWTVLTRPHLRRAGWSAVAGGGIMLLFGSVLQGLVSVGGVLLIAAGGVSFLSGLFRRGQLPR